MLRRMLAVAVILGAFAGCSGDDGNEGPTATVAAPDREPTTTSTTEALTPEEEVEAAYLKSWEVFKKAALELDPTGLEELYIGDALQIVLADIAKYTADNTPARFEVEHDYTVSVVSEGVAVVADNYLNHSVLLDGETLKPIEADPNEVVKQIYTLREVDRRWKVANIQASPS